MRFALSGWTVSQRNPAGRAVIHVSDWIRRGIDTLKLAGQWLDSMTEPLPIVPLVMMPLSNAPDRSVLINHRYSYAPHVRNVRAFSLELTAGLFQP